MRATLGLLEKVTLDPASVGAADVAPLRELGVSKQAVEDALFVSFCFNLIDRVADSFGWHVPGREDFQAIAKTLLKMGYKMPMHRVESQS